MPHLVVDGVAVCDIEVAQTFVTRGRGMLWRRRLPEALLLYPGGSVHGVGMTRSLDVALLVPAAAQTAPGRGGRAPGSYRVARIAVLRPFGLLGSRRGVRAVLEAPAGRFEWWQLNEASSIEVRPGPMLP